MSKKSVEAFSKAPIKTSKQLIVELKNLPTDGEEFHFSRKSAELNYILNELVPTQNYEVELSVRPAGNAFEVHGSIESTLELNCSRCGREVLMPFKNAVNELIVVTKERPRAGHSGHTGAELETGPFCNYLTHHFFNLGEFIYEQVAAAEPYTIYCKLPDCDKFLLDAQNKQESPMDVPDNPFAALKNIKL